jgi:hypothetical protein
MQNGAVMDITDDANDISITGTLNTSIDSVVVDVKSYFSMKGNGKATIKKLNENQIRWTLTKAPDGVSYLPEQVILTKQ